MQSSSPPVLPGIAPRWSRSRPGHWWAALLACLPMSLYPPAGLADDESALLVATRSGQLRGTRVDGVLAFRGIPYAAPPVGANRWRPPQPAPAWNGVRPALDYGPTCAQPQSALMPVDSRDTSEDCLTLNVWTPDTRPARPWPVMVWIHGGGFSQGSGNSRLLNGTALPRQGVVVVTINYRLAVFGFLAHPVLATDGDPVGNYGLLDAVAALGWVQENIAAFGGDPQRVTLFGESAGADAVNTLLAMPAARGLFQQAISQSSSVGLVPAPRVGRRAGFNPPAEAIADAYIRKLDLPAGTDLAATLRGLPAGQLLAAMGERDRFTPVVDGRTLPDQVGLIFARGGQAAVAYLTGGNSWEASLGRLIGGAFSPAIAARLVPVADQARLYPGLTGEALDDAVFGDLVILAASRYLADQMRDKGVPVHAYHFSYVAEDRRTRQPGAAHADDIPFVMGTLDADPDLARVTAQDRKVSGLMTRYWARFAATGDPNGPGLPEWPAWGPAPPSLLEIGNTVTAHRDFLGPRLEYHVQRGRKLLQGN